MALPVMSLVPDSKRSLKFRLSRTHAPTMLDTGGVAVYSTSSECAPTMVTNQESKFHPFFPQTTSFHARSKLIPSFDSFVVGGFLGSKSQMRSVNNPQKICDFICTEKIFQHLLGAATECINKYCDISAVPSPPKKKCSKEDLTIVDTIDFPSVINEQSPQSNIAEGSKQSYAEVAKAASSRPTKTDRSTDLNDNFGKQTSRNCRKPQSSDIRNSRRKLRRRDLRSNSLSSSGIINLSSPSSEIQSEARRDLRSNQQEKHFSQLKISGSRSNGKSDRLGSSTSSCSRQENHSRDRSSGSQNRHKRQSNHRSHSDSKRGCRSRNVVCDIDKINWRTGEPIGVEMGSEHVGDEYREDFSGERLSESLSMEHKNDECTEDQRNQEFSSSDCTSWTDLRSLSPRCRRRSIASECSVDSEDSFIIFQSNGVPSDSLSDLASDWSDCDSDDSFESDSEASDEADTCDGFTTLSPRRLKEVNDLWRKEYSLELLMTPENKDKALVTKECERKVCFSNSKPIVHRMLAWDYAYRSSRPGPWEQMARDRERFRTRIRQFEGIISPVLTSTHRKKIWNQLNTQ